MAFGKDRLSVGELTLPAGKRNFVFFDDALKGFGVRVRISADGQPLKRYCVVYRIGGNQRWVMIGDAVKLSEVQARKRATEMLAKVTLGIDPAAERQTARAANAITLKSVVEQYLQMREVQLENDKRRASSLGNTRLYLVKGDYFKPLHSKPINAIEKRDVAVRLNAITHDHSANTASAARRHLSAFFVWAMKEGIADANPVIGTNDPGSNPPRDRVLKDDELARIWRACDEAGEYGKVVKLLILTGCRRDEIGLLRWSWFDTDLTTMTIPSTVAKNHREHTLPITGMMRDIIGTVERMAERDFLFGQWGEGLSDWGYKAKLGDGISKPWQLRDLRRTLSTGMHEMGVEPHIVEAIINHVSGHKSGVAGVYNYARYGRQMKAALAMWSDHIASIISGGERKVVPLRTA